MKEGKRLLLTLDASLLKKLCALCVKKQLDRKERKEEKPQRGARILIVFLLVETELKAERG